MRGATELDMGPRERAWRCGFYIYQEGTNTARKYRKTQRKHLILCPLEKVHFQADL